MIVGDAVGVVLGDSSDFVIQHTSGGNFFEGSGSGSPVYIRAKVNEDQIKLNVDGSVELYHDNAKRFETTGIGITVGLSTIQHNGNAAFAGIVTVGSNLSVGGNLNVTGDIVYDEITGRNLNITGFTTFADDVLFQGAAANIRFDKSTDDLIFQDNAQAIFGSSSDGLHIFHDGSHSQIQDQGTGNLYITGSASVNIDNQAGEQMANFNIDGAVELFYDNGKTFETSPQGIIVSGVTTSNRLNISGVSTFTGNIDANGDLDVDGTANLDVIDVDGTANFADDVTLVAAGSSTILFDASAHKLVFQDNIRANFGTGSDLSIYHNGTNSFIDNDTGDLNIRSNDLKFRVKTSDELYLTATANGAVGLYHNNNVRITTTDDGADFGGTGSIKVPVGTTGERNASPAAGDFRYNSSLGKFEGYTDEWGEIGGGSVEETDTSVSTTSATSCGSFAIASFRSASIIAQITQGSNYQVGRYLVIHDGTTVTTIEESAVATGSMLGTFEGVINSSNLEFRVTMGSSSSATVTTKIDTVTV